MSSRRGDVIDLQVLRGRVRLVADSVAVELGAHQLGPVPARRHSVQAEEDAVVLLSVGR